MKQQYTVIAVSVSASDLGDTLNIGQALVHPSFSVEFSLGKGESTEEMIKRLKPHIVFLCSGSSIQRLVRMLDSLSLPKHVFVCAVVPDLTSYGAVRLIRRGIYCLPRFASYMAPASAAEEIRMRFLRMVEEAEEGGKPSDTEKNDK